MKPRHDAAPLTFTRTARWISHTAGTPGAFAVAGLIVAVWALTGPLFHYSDTWQLVINTGTTVVTFLMVFLIQNTQNRDSEAMHLKLDELIHAVRQADDHMIDIEALEEAELEALHARYRRLAAHAGEHLDARRRARAGA